jgi:hypothetical protein
MKTKNPAQINEMKVAVSFLNQAIQCMERAGSPMLAQKLAHERMRVELELTLATGQGKV